MIVTVMYQVAAGQKFDVDYYMKAHMPLVHRLWDSAGLKGSQVLKGTASPTGEPATYHVMTLLEFESMDAFGAAAQQHGKEVMGDIANFTDGTTILQFNDQLS